MSGNSKNSFLDSNTIVAMVITFGIFIGWQKYMDYKYPKSKAKIANQKKADTSSITIGGLNIKNENSPDLPKDHDSLEKNTPEKILTFEDDFWKFDLNSKGLAVENVEIKKINKVAQKAYKFLRTPAFYPTSIDGKTVHFLLERVDKKTFVGRSTYEGLILVKTIKVNSEKFLLDVTIDLEGKTNQSFSIEHKVAGQVQEPKTILFLPAFQRDEFYVCLLYTSDAADD